MKTTASRREAVGPAEAAQTAKDRAQFILGAISLVIWFAVAFGLSIPWYIDDDTAQPILMAGGIAFMVCTIPWLAYPWLVRRFSQA